MIFWYLFPNFVTEGRVYRRASITLDERRATKMLVDETEGDWSRPAPLSPKAKSIKEPFFHVGKGLDCGLPFHTNMEFSNAVAKIIKLVHELGFACVSSISLRPNDMSNFKLHTITLIVDKTWVSLSQIYEWIQEGSMELHERKIMWFLQDDIEVPCIMQWRLLWCSAPSHLNEMLIKGGVFQTCHDKTIKKPWRHLSPSPKAHANVYILGTTIDDDTLSTKGGVAT